jgi:hypothetical protein
MLRRTAAAVTMDMTGTITITTDAIVGRAHHARGRTAAS